MATSESKEIPSDLKHRLKNTYDLIAEKYNNWANRESSIRLKYLQHLLPPLTSDSNEKHVLELGCGAGIPVTQTLASINHIHITANDMSTVQIGFAKQNIASLQSTKVVKEKIEFIEGDMMSISFPNASLDAVVAMYSLIHLPQNEQVTLLERISDWLKPGGYLLANFAEQEATSIVDEHWMHEKGWTFWSGLGVQGTLDAIKKASLEVEFHEVSIDVVDANFLWVLARKPL
jgi:ubiquinone/menaquinone biosynthesis C-methylase UbiE